MGTDFLQKVLKYHVVGDVMPYADLTDGATMPTRPSCKETCGPARVSFKSSTPSSSLPLPSLDRASKQTLNGRNRDAKKRIKVLGKDKSWRGGGGERNHFDVFFSFLALFTK